MSSFPISRLNFGGNSPRLVEESWTQTCKLWVTKEIITLCVSIYPNCLLFVQVSKFLPGIGSIDTFYKQIPYFLAFLFSGASFHWCINPPFLQMALSSDWWYRISLNTINMLPSVSHEMIIDSYDWFANTSTPSPPLNTASYALVSNIGLSLQMPMSYPSISRFICATVVCWYPSTT